MKIGTILKINKIKDLKKEVTEKEYKKLSKKINDYMDLAGFEYDWQFFDMYQDGAREAQKSDGLSDEDDYIDLIDYIDACSEEIKLYRYDYEDIRGLI